MLSNAWRSVSPATISNCWQKAGFQLAASQTPSEISEEPELPPPQGMSEVEFNQWVAIDDDATVEYQMTQEEEDEKAVDDIVSSIKISNASVASENNNASANESNDEDEEEEENPTEKQYTTL